MTLGDCIEVRCPWCGERVEIVVEWDAAGEEVRDCEVCCRPWCVVVRRDEWGDPEVQVEQSQ